ncbi:MAG: Protein DipZ [Gammaproteobacteria bacterium]|nr:Protein DipZ [Gammaproteobacteria bacterium]
MRSFRALLWVAAVAAVLWVVSARPWVLGAERPKAPRPAPEFTHGGEIDWINSKPLKLSDLEGRVVLVDFWTYGCWNCKRSFPWVKKIESRFADDALVVIGVHTPEFKHEMDRARVREHVAEFDLNHPVMVDNDFSYWNAMNNRYWPTFYLIDKSGRIRQEVIGEIRSGHEKAETLESRIRMLLSETA